ncbi:hypothetical protein NYR97_05040 [Xanthomonas hydrangeae]|uniref:Uncharacterized protein n=1 Tax=Xanthomonas hydrangeae TaxID=2775159 RepID=A0AAU0BFS9_9XANT|nr:hypothetical protein [Xanthomonas hydrangeae]WOB50766.1 hypothetical protein NYR97_05040 [Xanthomonas hydrangeae]
MGFANAVNRGRQANGGRTHAALAEQTCGLFRTARVGRIRCRQIGLAGDPTERTQRRQGGGHQQRLVAALQRIAQRVDHQAILRGIFGIAGKIVIEGQMDHAIGSARGRAQAVQIVQRCVQHIGAFRLQRLRFFGRPRQTEHAMPVLQQLIDHRCAHPTGGTCDEHLHVNLYRFRRNRNAIDARDTLTVVRLSRYNQ